jgi:integrase
MDLVTTTAITKEQAIQIIDRLAISDNSRADYKSRIGPFIDFVNTHKPGIDSLLKYRQYLSGRNDYSTATKNKYLAAARIYLKELNRRGLISNDITQNIKSFQQSSKHKKDGLTAGEINQVKQFTQSLDSSPAVLRLKAIISLLALQGLRQIEVIRLDVEDLDLNRGTAFILGKGRDDKERINLQPPTIAALQDYLSANNIKSGALFVSNSNNSKNRRLTTKSIRILIKQVLRRLNIDKTTHGFRHYFTTNLIKDYKGDLLTVQKYTRHKSVEMLQVYNDAIIQEADLPRFYAAFEGIRF